MDKFFPASVRHAKAREFLELKQGSMTVLEYVAKFTELARFRDDYMTTNMAKVRKFEDGLRLSIQGKIIGADAICSFLPQHGPGEPMSVRGCCTSTYYFADGPNGPKHGSGRG